MLTSGKVWGCVWREAEPRWVKEVSIARASRGQVIKDRGEAGWVSAGEGDGETRGPPVPKLCSSWP